MTKALLLVSLFQVLLPAFAQTSSPSVSALAYTGGGSSGSSSSRCSSSFGRSNSAGSSSGGTIPGTLTDATLIAKYPAESYPGYTASTSDLGLEQSDGVRWLILNPPIPPAASTLGYTKLIYAIHPVVSDVDVLGTATPGQCYFANGQPGINYGAAHANFTGSISGTTLTVNSITGTIAVDQVVQGAGVAPGTKITSTSAPWHVSVSQTARLTEMTSGYFWMLNGQLTLAGGAAAPSIMAAATNNNGVNFANMKSALPFLSASSGYYLESATHISNSSGNDNDHWASFWTWTTEAMSGGYSGPWVEFDINEWGFDYYPTGNKTGATLFGVTTSLNNHTSLRVNTAKQMYSPATLLMTDEHIIGGAWNPRASPPNVQQWLDGSKTAMKEFSSVSMPAIAWQGLHQFPIFGAGSHGYISPAPHYDYSIRYVMAWGPP
jgi:hypothetical protein